MSLDWRTEEREDDESDRLVDDSTGEPRRAPQNGRQWAQLMLFLAVAGLMTATLGALVYRQLASRAEAGRQRVEAEVLASHATIERAVTEGDVELFIGFLSGRDPLWRETQESLVRSGRFLNRSDFGMTLMSNTAPLTPTITLNNDLRAAEVVAPRRYMTVTPDGTRQTIILAQTAVFRQGPDRWLLAPPDPGFWGEMNTVGQNYLLIRYPERDGALVERLSRDIDAMLREMCAELSSECPRLTITMTTSPAALAAYQEPLERLRGGAEIVLPAPTLVGIPADDAGYRALLREYAARVAGATLANYAGWACCENALFYVELLEAQLNALGLRPWTNAPINFERLVEDPAAVRQLWGSATVAPAHADIWPVHGLVDFLLNSTDHQPIPEMQRLLLSGTTPTFWEWLDEVTNDSFQSAAAFERALMRYAVARRLTPLPPISLPEHDLQLVCHPADARHAALFRLDPSGGALRHEYDFGPMETPVIAPLPSRDGVVLSGIQTGNTVRGPFVWREGRAIEVTLDTADRLSLIPLPAAANRPAPLLASYSPFDSWPVYAELAADECAGGRCTARAWAGAPHRSPNGEYVLLVVGEPADGGYPILYVGDGRGEAVALVGSGTSPFWLDEDTFGYLAPRPDLSGQAVVLRDVHAARSTGRAAMSTAQRTATGGARGAATAGPALSEATELLTTSDLENIPLLSPAAEKFIDHVLPSPDESSLFLITANPLNQGRVSYVIEYDLATGALTGRFSFSGEPADYRRRYLVSPDGRWLVVGVRLPAMPSARETVWRLHIHGIGDLATRGLTRVQELTTDDDRHAEWPIDWAPDGRWLAVTSNGYIRLFAPHEDHILPLIVDDLACSAAVWVNER